MQDLRHINYLDPGINQSIVNGSIFFGKCYVLYVMNIDQINGMIIYIRFMYRRSIELCQVISKTNFRRCFQENCRTFL